ncbi:AEC family transporter [Cupriavidus basilensis]
MLDILAIIAPIYIAILIGYSMTRAGIFAKADMRVFGRFVINLALPALLFRTLSQRQLGEILNVSYLLAYFLGSWAMVGLGYLWCRRAAGLNPATSAFYAMGMSCSNSGYVGYPILLLTLAPVAGVSLALNMTVENPLLHPLPALHGREQARRRRAMACIGKIADADGL